MAELRVVSTPASRPFSRTGTADAPSFVDIGVKQVVGMTLRAVGLHGVRRRDDIATEDVLFGSDGLKVVGVHASPNPAKVVKLKPLRYRALQQFVGEAVGGGRHTGPINAAGYMKEAVSVLGFACRPKPTRMGFVDFRPETLFGRDWLRAWAGSMLGVHLKVLLSGVMRQGVHAPLSPSIVPEGGDYHRN